MLINTTCCWTPLKAEDFQQKAKIRSCAKYESIKIQQENQCIWDFQNNKVFQKAQSILVLGCALTTHPIHES